MNRISSLLPDQKQLAFQALSWITCAKRPLKTVELQHALAVEPDEREFDEDNLPDLQDVVSSCCGLVTVNEQTQVIRLVHYTTQEYFERTQRIWFPDGQSDILHVCMTYLSYKVFNTGRCFGTLEFKDRLSSYPLYDYASHYWGQHARSITSFQYRNTFLETQPQVDAAAEVLLARGTMVGGFGYSRSMRRYVTGLHLVAFFGLNEAVPFFIGRYSCNARDSFGRTPLSYAIESGHEPMARLLLEAKAEVDSRDEYYGQTPLSFAAKSGHKAIVRLLVEAKADAGSRDKYGKTPLVYAARSGHEAVVRLLQEHLSDSHTSCGGGTMHGNLQSE